jgi:hypothetical protein
MPKGRRIAATAFFAALELSIVQENKLHVLGIFDVFILVGRS